jgi:hypothetical protein
MMLRVAPGSENKLHAELNVALRRASATASLDGLEVSITIQPV